MIDVPEKRPVTENVNIAVGGNYSKILNDIVRSSFSAALDIRNGAK